MRRADHWKRPWCWERLKAKGEGDNKGCDDWIASPTQWMWIWANWEIVEERGVWRAVVHRVAKSWKQLSDCMSTVTLYVCVCIHTHVHVTGTHKEFIIYMNCHCNNPNGERWWDWMWMMRKWSNLWFTLKANQQYFLMNLKVDCKKEKCQGWFQNGWK